MSIAPPSDIILDVAQAGDPLKVQAATSKLVDAARAAGAPAVSFDEALSAAAAPLQALAVPVNRIGPDAFVHAPNPETRQATADRKFEAMVLQNFIENILPKDTELFGDKASADMCRTLLAEQLSSQLAKSSRLGIAKSLERFQNASAAAQADTAALLAAKAPGA